MAGVIVLKFEPERWFTKIYRVNIRICMCHVSMFLYDVRAWKTEGSNQQLSYIETQSSR